MNIKKYLDKKYRFWHILAIAFILLRLPSLFEPYWYGDEGVYLTIGQAIRRGLVLYRDIHDNKPPLLYFLAAISQTVFGFRLLLAIWMIPTIYFFYRLAFKIFNHDRAAKLATAVFFFFSSIPLIEGTIANSEIFMLLPTILGIYLVYTAKKPSAYLWAGLSLGIALTLKMPVVVEFVFICFWLVTQKHQLKPILLLATGFVLPLSLLGIYYYFHGVFGYFINASLLQNFGYLSSWATGSHSGNTTQSGLIIRASLLISAYLALFFLRHRLHLSRLSYFILLWFLATLFGSLLSERPYPHYLIQLLPSFALLFTLAFTSRLVIDRLLVTFSFLILAFSLLFYHFYFYPNLAYYHNFYSYLFRLKNITQYRSFFGANVNTTYQIAEFINRQQSGSDRIFVWGDHPYLYALTNTLPTGRYTVAYHVVDFNGYQEVDDKMRSHLPSTIVYYSMNNRPFPQLESYLLRYYFVVHQFDEVLVFQLRQ